MRASATAIRFGVTAIELVTGELRFRAEVFATRFAVITVAAAGVAEMAADAG